MKVAAYVRPWSRSYFEYFLGQAFPDAQPLLISDFRGLGDYDWSGRFYAHLSTAPGNVRCPYWLDIDTELEIIARSYLLRSMSMQKASRLLRAMSRAIENMLDAISPDAFVSPSVDSYVMDLLVHHCVHRDIPFCGLLPCPFPGYTRVTARGEYFSFRTPGVEECRDSIAKVVDPSFRPVDLTEWLKMYGSNLVYLKRSLRELPKPYIFPLLARLRRDPMNYHYMASALTSVSFVSQALRLHRFFRSDWIERVSGWRGTTVYLPLQAFPECTTDYHVAEMDLIDFPRLMPRALDALTRKPGVLVCVKEHPGMMGARPPDFYEQILARRNVVLISGDVSAAEVIARCDIVLTWTGTSGFEAALRGKPVVTIGKPYYSCGPLFRNVRSLAQLDDLASVTGELKNITPTEGTQEEVARHVLSGTFPGEFRFIRFNARDESLRRDADALARGLRIHWASWRDAFLDKAFEGSTGR